jgi:hypothetical protein
LASYEDYRRNYFSLPSVEPNMQSPAVTPARPHAAQLDGAFERVSVCL